MHSTKSSNKQPQPASIEPLHQWSFEAIGTQWWIALYEPAPDDIQQQVAERIEAFDKTYSRFRHDSLVAAISEHAGTYDFPPDSERLFTFYRQLYDVTDGAVTPLIGNVLSDAGYDADYSLKVNELHQPKAWDDVLQFSDGVLKTTEPVLLDFGAAGKGYLVDLVFEVLTANGVTAAAVDASGDMLYKHQTDTLRVGMEHPDDATKVIGVVNLQNKALCGSAGNRRAWDKYHHIMNPFTLESASDVKAVWVTADTAMQADGLTTALFFCTPETLRALEFEFVVVNNDNSMIASPNFPAELF